MKTTELINTLTPLGSKVLVFEPPHDQSNHTISNPLQRVVDRSELGLISGVVVKTGDDCSFGLKEGTIVFFSHLKIKSRLGFLRNVPRGWRKEELSDGAINALHLFIEEKHIVGIDNGEGFTPTQNFIVAEEFEEKSSSVYLTSRMEEDVKDQSRIGIVKKVAVGCKWGIEVGSRVLYSYKNISYKMDGIYKNSVLIAEEQIEGVFVN